MARERKGSILGRAPGEGAGDLDQVDVLDRQQREHKGGDELDAGTVPG